LEEKFMKKLLSLMLVLMLTVSMLAGCGGETESSDSSAPEKPVASEKPTTTTDSKDATVMEELRLIRDLQKKNETVVKVYNEVANLAVKNGWEADQLTLRELNEANAVIKIFNSIIESPSSAHGSDLPEMLSVADDLIKELDTNLRQRVSVPFASKK
jgi:predicted small lipoprotein YifL